MNERSRRYLGHLDARNNTDTEINAALRQTLGSARVPRLSADFQDDLQRRLADESHRAATWQERRQRARRLTLLMAIYWAAVAIVAVVILARLPDAPSPQLGLYLAVLAVSVLLPTAALWLGAVVWSRAVRPGL